MNLDLKDLNSSLVWISGRNLTKATHYVHGFIRDGRSWINKTKKDKKGTHYIMEKYCRFGRRASLAICKIIINYTQ